MLAPRGPSPRDRPQGGLPDGTGPLGGAFLIPRPLAEEPHWPGAKPVVLVTATRSHAGKGTIIDMIRGATEKIDLLYENIDWPMRHEFQKQLSIFPDAGVVILDNVRLDSAGGRGSFIRSAFLESFVTTSEIALASPGSGEAIRLVNNFVVILNTNDGRLSENLQNRSLPVHLAPRGSIHERVSPIGNPKLEFLPRNQARIEAELRGMIERWRMAGCPLDEKGKHPMGPWARTVGRILAVNGFTGFLANARDRRSADNPVAEALAILGASSPGRPLRPREWAELAQRQGLVKTLIPPSERDTPAGRERAIGGVLHRHVGEAFSAETETVMLGLRLAGGKRRWTPGANPYTCYVFQVESETLHANDETPETGQDTEQQARHDE